MPLKEFYALRLLVDNLKGLYGSDFVDLTKGKLGRGSIYTILDRLADKGYVRESLDSPTAEAPLPRTRHVITAKGIREYQRFLEDHGLVTADGVFAR